MRIVHIEDYFDPQAGYQINELLSISKKFNDEVILLTSTCMKPFHKNLDISKDKLYEKNTGIKIIRLNPLFIISTRIFYKHNIFKIIDKLNPDIVFMHGIGDFKDFILWKKKKDYIIIRDCHMSWVASKNKFRNIYYIVFKNLFSNIINRTNKYKKVFALGQEEYEYLKALGIADEKINYLYHGYNKNNMFFDYDNRIHIRKKYNIQNDDILVGYVGKFDYNKRPDLIFDILSNLNKKYLELKNIKLIFIGSKDQNYMNNIFNNKLEKYKELIEIIILDVKPFIELKNYFSATDILIFPKECTLSSIHAQVCGSTVIMESHISNKERVVNNNNLYNIGDLNQASNILERIIDNKEYINRIDVEKTNIIDREYTNQVKKIRNLVYEK